MLNPIEFKHDIASRPLKWLTSKPGKDWNDWYFAAVVMVGIETAAVNLAPAWTLIQAGYRGDMLYSHTTFRRFSPWSEPIFHYTQKASRAERIGGAVGGPIGKFLWADIWPVFDKTRKAWGKAGTKAGVKIGAKVGGRLIPGVGWALLAYDVYDIAYNRSLWGFDF